MTNALPNPAAVAILAGGKATRFGGQDKGEIIIDGQRLIDIIHERLVSQSRDIIISGTHDYGLGLDIVPDSEDAPGGPVGGIYSIWKRLLQINAEGFFTVAVDGPNLPDDLVSGLYARNYSTVATDEAGRHPTYGWWRVADLARVFNELDLKQSVSLNRLADLTDAKEVEWTGDKSFININRPGDLDKLGRDA